MADNTPKGPTGPNPRVVAKFVVTERTEYPSGGFGIRLQAVHGNSPENQRFFQYTPNAAIELRTINVAAAAQFDPGKELYVTFQSEAPITDVERQNLSEQALVSFGNYLLERYNVQVTSSDGQNTPLYQREVTHADLCNWRKDETAIPSEEAMMNGQNELE